MTDGFITLTLEVTEEGKQFVSRCKELDVTSCGDSLDEAMENIRKATLQYLNAIHELGESPRIFKEKGIVIRKRAPATVRREYRVSPGSLVGPYVTRVPVTA
ncbi:MAG: type II toxin-antitoxin system HicB family antitoxin [Dehalococcoidia bacterium]